MEAATANDDELRRPGPAADDDLARCKALRESEDKYRTLVETSPDAVLMTDLEGHVTYASQRALEMYGTDRAEDLLGRNPLELVVPEDREQFIANLRLTMQRGITRDVEYTFIRKDGSKLVGEASAAVIRDESGEPWAMVAIVRDITERKQTLGALAKQQRTLKHLLQSSDRERQLIAYEIHDGLAQQLAGAIMQFQTCEHLKETDPAEAAAAYQAGLAMLRQGHFEARRLIVGVRPPVLDESGVREAIVHLINELQRQQGPKIEFRTSVAFDRLVPVLENAVYRICQEGLTNAFKHSQSPRVRVSLAQRQDRLRIVIRDWGVGFDPRRARENSFGLEGIRQRARLLGGKCSIKSKLGVGTSISVEVPVVEPEAEK